MPDIRRIPPSIKSVPIRNRIQLRTVSVWCAGSGHGRFVPRHSKELSSGCPAQESQQARHTPFTVLHGRSPNQMATSITTRIAVHQLVEWVVLLPRRSGFSPPSRLLSQVRPRRSGHRPVRRAGSPPVGTPGQAAARGLKPVTITPWPDPEWTAASDPSASQG